MLGPIQPRAIRLYCIEQQSTLGAILHWVRNYRNWVARFVRDAIPALTDHDVNARSLDVPRSDSGRVLRVIPNRDDDVAVWVLPPILLYDASIGNILGHIEHRAGMMGEGGTRRKEQDSYHNHQSQNCSHRLHLICGRRLLSEPDRLQKALTLASLRISSHTANHGARNHHFVVVYPIRTPLHSAWCWESLPGWATVIARSYPLSQA